MQLVITKIKIRNGKGDGPHRADPKSKHGSVEFDIDADATVTFTPDSVFGRSPYRFYKGRNELDVTTEAGATKFTVAYDTVQPTTKQANVTVTAGVQGGNGPNDIIVP